MGDGETLCFASRREGGYGGPTSGARGRTPTASGRSPVNQGRNINTAAEEFHFSQDADGRVYFTSARPGGQGGMDIWSAMQTGLNSWGPAVGLGPHVNTPGQDMCRTCARPFRRTAPPSRGSRTGTDNSLGGIDIFWTNRSNLATGPER